MSKPSFIAETPVRSNRKKDKVLSKKFRLAEMFYNNCLGEALRRLKLARESKTWQKARKEKNKSARSKLYQSVQKTYQLSEYDLHAYATTAGKKSRFNQHLDSNTIQKIATRAHQSMSEYMYGKRGRPRFKSKGQLKSVEGKTNSSGIRFKNGKVIWGKLELDLIYDKKDKHGVQAHALNCETKYVRLVRRRINNKTRYFAQLVQKGHSLIKEKNQASEGKVGLDLGPSTIAMVSKDKAKLSEFCPGLKTYDRKIKKKQRLLSRSRRMTNPNNFLANGTIKPGKKQWARSKRYLKLQREVADLQRKNASARKCMHGELANEILGMGKHINLEKLSYKSFQRRWGKSVLRRAPSTFVDMLKIKAERAGGSVAEISTIKTRLSQVCHGCSRYKKKKLSERWHVCSCGIGPVQRDLYSGFLCLCVKNNGLDINQAEMLWSGAKPLLEQAVSRLNESANGKSRLASFGLSKTAQRQSALSVKDGSMRVDVADVVRPQKPESREKTGNTAIKTPGL